MAIATETLGDWQGEPVTQATLRAGRLRLQAMNFGAITTSLSLNGNPLILGYPDLASYVADRFFVGAIVGRIANRVKDARFKVNGKAYQMDANEGQNALHGGTKGIHKRLWKMETDEANNAVRFMLQSPVGDQGCPGEMTISVTIRLDPNAITYQIAATPSEASPVNLAQHNYYNLGGNLLDHEICIFADEYTPTDGDKIPTGELRRVTDGFDLREMRKIRDIGDPASFIDHNFVLSLTKLPQVSLAGEHARFDLRTNLPGVQFYSGGGLGKPFGPHQGLCLEPQYFPNSVNQDGFSNCIHSPDRPYVQVTRLEIK